VRQFHRPEQVQQDPVAEVRRFSAPADREVAGLLAASLAYGSLPQIRRSVREALSRLGEHPAATLAKCRARWELETMYQTFRHRWTSGRDVADLLWAVRECRRHWGSLENAMLAGRPPAEPLRESLVRFIARLTAASGGIRPNLLADPRRGSACKRLLLFLRWMVRCDQVDPGGWSRLHPRELMMPLDVHTFRAARQLGLTRRRTPTWNAAEEITAQLQRLAPEDPVRYDFALAHAGAARRRPRYNERRSAAPR